MKTLTTCLAAAFFASSVNAASTFEIVNTQFIEGINYQEQQEAMDSLNSVVKHFEGFQSRRYFYSKTLNRWTDIVVWENEDLALSATEKAMQNPQAQQIFSIMDMESTIFSHYEPKGHIEAKSAIK